MATAMAKGQLEAKLKEEHELIDRGVLREENPLDLSEDFGRFLEACRRGDLKQCQEHIAAGVNINGKDAFDYTPLIVASLCGHYEVAQLLLESGALAERNTFQGERCLYNALNDRIRNLLLQYDYSKSTDPLQPWASHLTSLLTRTTPPTADIALTAGGGGGGASGGASASFRLHRFLLAARTPYFYRKLTEAPDTATWRLASHVPPAALRIVLHYLYLDDSLGAGRPRGGDDPESGGGGGGPLLLVDDEELFRGIDRIAKHLEIDQQRLWEAVLAAGAGAGHTGNDRRLARQRYQDEVARAQQQVAAFFRQHVLGNKMAVDARKVADVQWPRDNFIFADCLLCAEEEGEEEEGEEEEEDETAEDEGEGAETRIPVGPAAAAAHEPAPHRPPRRPRRAVLYPAHKAMLVRADYFATMFASAFVEAQASARLRVIRVDCAPAVLEIVLAFLYTEEADIPLGRALDVLYLADMLLLDKLKTKAAVIISTLGSADADADADDRPPDLNIYDVLHAAWDLKVQRLEAFAARFLAQRLEHYVDEPAFADLVAESAHRLTTRHETDSIELVDDIRYYLSERFRLRFEDMALDEMEEAAGEQRDDNAGAEAAAAEAAAAPAPAPGILRTLDGRLAAMDEFDSDALNYQILLAKIDALLERLGLDG